MTPVVSVIIPAYRVAQYIPATLQSVMAQTYRDYEVIVVDQDMNEAMATALQPFSERIVHLKKDPTNLASARNCGAKHARGRYLAFLDGDDCWAPDFLSDMVPMIEAGNGLDVVYANAVFFGRPDTDGILFQSLFPSKRPISFLSILKRECYVFSSALVRRSIFERVGGCDDQLSSAEDFDLWLRIAEAGGRFDFTSKPLVRYRLRPNSLTTNRTNMCKTTLTVYSKYLHHSAADIREAAESGFQKVQAEFQLEMSKQFILTGAYSSARTCLQAANAHYKRTKLRAVELLLQTVPSLVQWALRRSRQRVQATYAQTP